MSGPRGISKKIKIKNNKIHIIARLKEYGNRVDINFPRLIFGSYFFANTKIIGKYGSKGVMIFVVESAIRKAAWVVSGANPNIIIIGTNTGEITAHFADALVTKKFINIEKSMKLNISQMPLNPISFKKLAPLTASTKPRFDQLKYARNCAAAKAKTI